MQVAVHSLGAPDAGPQVPDGAVADFIPPAPSAESLGPIGPPPHPYGSLRKVARAGRR